MKTKDIEIGSKFEELTVIEYLGIIKRMSFYLCKCSCGEIIKIRKSRLVNQKFIHEGCKNILEKKHFNLKYTPQEASFRAKASNYRATAKQRGYDFLLTNEETIKLLKSNCYYCGIYPNNTYNAIIRNRNNKERYIFYKEEEYNINYSGIDRINSSKGYTIDNVVSCCKYCNTAKLDRSIEDFKNWVKLIYNNLYPNESGR